jgi:hypothetical protein
VPPYVKAWTNVVLSRSERMLPIVVLSLRERKPPLAEREDYYVEVEEIATFPLAFGTQRLPS